MKINSLLKAKILLIQSSEAQELKDLNYNSNLLKSSKAKETSNSNKMNQIENNIKNNSPLDYSPDITLKDEDLDRDDYHIEEGEFKEEIPSYYKLADLSEWQRKFPGDEIVEISSQNLFGFHKFRQVKEKL